MATSNYDLPHPPQPFLHAKFSSHIPASYLAKSKFVPSSLSRILIGCSHPLNFVAQAGPRQQAEAVRALQATVDMECQGSFSTLPNATNYSLATLEQMRHAVARDLRFLWHVTCGFCGVLIG